MPDPNVVIPDKLGFPNEAQTRFYFIEERTPLVRAVENGHTEMFDLLINYVPLVDVNGVCYEWSTSSAYKC